MLVKRGCPGNEEWQLRIVDEIKHSDLSPLQVVAVRTPAVTVNRCATEARFDRRKVIDCDDPPEPTAARIRAIAYCATERCLFRRRMIKRRDDFDIRIANERQHEVLRSESWVSPTVEERGPEVGAEALHGVCEFVVTDGI